MGQPGAAPIGAMGWYQQQPPQAPFNHHHPVRRRRRAHHHHHHPALLHHLRHHPPLALPHRRLRRPALPRRRMRMGSRSSIRTTLPPGAQQLGVSVLGENLHPAWTPACSVHPLAPARAHSHIRCACMCMVQGDGAGHRTRRILGGHMGQLALPGLCAHVGDACKGCGHYRLHRGRYGRTSAAGVMTWVVCE